MVVYNLCNLIYSVLEAYQRQLVVFIHYPDAVAHTITVKTVEISHYNFVVPAHLKLIHGYYL